MARMNPALARRLKWEARRLGWAAAVGAAALALAAFGGWQSQLETQRQRMLATQLANALAPHQAPQAEAPDAARRIAAFNAFLPPHEALPELLKKLVGVAADNGITLAKADYKAQPEDGADFLRYQITLPLKADFARIQAFTVGALRALPTLTLETVAFKREQIGNGEVEARIQLSLLLRKPKRGPR
ncbi:MAG: hypothetical protein V4508_17675 [Pseudomonadota bacterium]